MKLYNLAILRKCFLPLLKRFNPGDISIRNPYSKEKLKLHSFLHKGYWYHGANREKETMLLFQELIEAPNTVIEVGGHIGYITQYFSKLVGSAGFVYVFEPGSNNLGYLKHNTAALTNVQLVEKAVCDSDGKATFYLDDLTGQNNSIVPDYDVLAANQKNSFTKSGVTEMEVETVRLDTFISQHKVTPDFVKIDIEGAELLALRGMSDTCNSFRPIIMVEVTNNNDEVRTLLNSWGYLLFDENCREISEDQRFSGNVFCFHENRHGEIINRMRTVSRQV